MNWGQIVEFLQNNWVQICVVFTTINMLLKAWADSTETKKDDKIVAKISAAIGYIFGKRPK